MLKGQKLFSGAGLVAVAVLLIVINLAAGVFLKGQHLDMTANRLYTLSEGTQNILGNLDEKITLRFYFSEQLFSGMPAITTYGQQVKELLEQYVALADGQIELVVKNPEPFSDEEAEAMHYRLQGTPVDTAGSLAYFGLVGGNAAGKWRALPYFQPEQEESLEYELSGLVYGLANPQRPVVGLISSLPLDGGPANVFLDRTQEWFILTQLKRSFDIQDLGNSPESIPENVDVLMIVHPKQTDEKTLFAIDQYVLGGGRVLAFLDPFAEADVEIEKPAEGEQEYVTSARASDLGKLMEAWGVELVPYLVAADRQAATRIKSTVGGQEKGVVDYVAWLTLGEDNFSREDFVSGRLNSLVMGSAGILRQRAGAKTRFTPMVMTSDQSMPIDAASIQFFTSPEELLQAYQSGGEPFVLAARVNGNVLSAFPEGINGGGESGRLTESSEPANVIIVADTDMLRDMFWVSFQDFYGRRAAVPSADNDTFVINALDNLSGSNDLINLRSRGRSVRPFERVADLRAAADQEFRIKELLLQEKLSATGHKIRELQKEVTSETGEPVMSEAQLDEINKFRAEHIQIRKDLRNVQHALSKDIELLGTRLKIINIALVPLVVIVLAIILGVVRVRRAARDQ
ncbi:MAG: Gldg family protein [Pseudomonadota bacterium]